MKKWQIENSEKSEISEKLFRVFLFPSFRFWPTAKIENSNLKISKKSFWDFQDFRSSRVFDLACLGSNWNASCLPPNWLRNSDWLFDQ